MGQAADCFTGRVDSGFFPKTKIAKRPVKVFRPYFLTDLDRSYVAGIFYNLLQRQPAVGVGIVYDVFPDFIGTIFAEKYCIG